MENTINEEQFEHYKARQLVKKKEELDLNQRKAVYVETTMLCVYV